MSLWSDSYISQIAEEAEHKISLEVNCIVHRFSLNIYSGVPDYFIPDYVTGIRRVTWKGTVLTYITQLQAARYFPLLGASIRLGAFQRNAFQNNAFLTGGVVDGSQRGRPEFYGFAGVNREAVRFYPAPNETIAATTSGLFGPEIPNRAIIEVYRLPDVTTTQHRVPEFTRRRLVKAYVLWKVFSREGDGQNLDAAKYFESKFNFGIALFKSSHSRIFSAKINVLRDQGVYRDMLRDFPQRPQLPWNYRTVENLK